MPLRLAVLTATHRRDRTQVVTIPVTPPPWPLVVADVLDDVVGALRALPDRLARSTARTGEEH